MNDAPPPMPPRPQYLPGFGPPQSLPPGFLPDHAPTLPPAPTRPRHSVGGVVLFLAVGLGTGLLVLAGIGVATYPAVRRARHQAQHVNSVNAAVDKAVAAVERAIADARDDLVRLSGDERLLDPTTIHSQRELDRRAARFESTVQSLREARRGADAARQQLRQDLAALGVARDVRDQWLARCDQQSEWPTVSDAFGACEKFAVRARDLLRYLRNTWASGASTASASSSPTARSRTDTTSWSSRSTSPAPSC